jgi:glycerophosphoryl diester phosphodiesterase
MKRVVEAGADGMTVNFPDKLIACLNEHGRQWQ